jgi:histidine triad (HIT) family protein
MSQHKTGRSWVGRLLFGATRSHVGGSAAGWAFSYLWAILPVRRVGETASVVAFHHPRPSHRVHVLIVPKRRIRNFLAVSPDDVTLMQDVIVVAQRLVRELKLVEPGYRLVINGGAYQDVQQLHVHLISG